MTQRELPMLAGIAAVIRWFESLILLLAGPLLTIGLGVAVVDLATNNALLNSVPWLLVAWGVAMAIGLDAQVIAAWDRVGVAFRQRQWFVLVLYLVVGVALGYVGYIACAVFRFEHALGYSEQQALSMMGVNAMLYQYQRAFLAVALVALSALNRYHPPQASLADERAEIHRELEMTPLRLKLTEMRATGAVNVARAVGNAAVGKQTVKRSAPTPPRYPTGPGTPAAARPTTDEGHEEGHAVLRLTQPEPTAHRQAAHVLSIEARCRKVLAKHGDISKRQLARLVGCSDSTAARWKRVVAQEQAEAGELAN
jgi:hypothetical protein